MNILLTGASGFLGSYVLQELIKANHKIAILCRHSSNLWRIDHTLNYEKFIIEDNEILVSEDNFQKLVYFEPECIIHLAWCGVGNFARNEPDQLTNINFSVNLLKLSAKLGIKYFIGTGSQAECGPRSGAIDETCELNPTTLYGATKAATYLLCKTIAKQSNINFSWCRIFSLYGPKDEQYWMIPQLIITLLHSKAPSLTEGLQLWDYCYVVDAARAIRFIAESKRELGIINIGSGLTVPIKNIIEQIRDLIDSNLKLGFGEIQYRPDQVMHLEANIKKLQDSLLWQPEVSLKQGLYETVNWYKKNIANYECQNQ